MVTKIKEFIKTNLKTFVLAVCILLGSILMIAGSIVSHQQDDTGSVTGEDRDLAEYTKKLEEKLAEVVSRIDGAGKCTVMVTLDTSFETVYANNASIDEKLSDMETPVSKTERTSEKQLVLLNSKESGETPIVVKEICPRIKGVVVVCDGGSDSEIQSKIIQAASVAFHLSTNRIYVTGSS